MTHDSAQRQARAGRRVTQKRTPHGKCIRQEYTQTVTPRGLIVGRVRYYHVTKGWRTRLA